MSRKSLLLSLLLFLLLASPASLGANPATNPVFATIDWVEDELSELQSGVEQVLQSLADRLESQEGKVAELASQSDRVEARYRDVEERLSALEEQLPGRPVPPTPSDDFDDGSLDGARWTLAADGGHYVQETVGRLEIGRTAGAQGWAGVDSNFRLSGDFELQVSFQLEAWPPAVLKLGIVATEGQRLNTIERVSGWEDVGEAYLTHFEDTIFDVPTGDTGGKLRLVRQGSLWRGYVAENETWRLIHEGPGIVQDVPIQLKLWGDSSPAAKVAFDDFIVQVGRAIWP